MANEKKNGNYISIWILIGLFFLIFGLFKFNQKGYEAQKIIELIEEDDAVGFLNNNVVDESKLSVIRNMDYNQLKKEINVREDFCIYLEDENNNVILSKGSPVFNLEGIECS